MKLRYLLSFSELVNIIISEQYYGLKKKTVWLRVGGGSDQLKSTGRQINEFFCTCRNIPEICTNFSFLSIFVGDLHISYAHCTCIGLYSKVQINKKKLGGGGEHFYRYRSTQSFLCVFELNSFENFYRN